MWFGERWITSIFDLFEENVRYFPSLLPELSDEDPKAELAAGRTPALGDTNCGCTTGRSTGGTGPSTTWCAAGLTCGWRTACCPRVPR